MPKISGNGKSKTLKGTNSDDIILGWGVTIDLHGFVTEDISKNSNEFLYGNRGNDYLYGGAGRDALYGDSGNDQLFGGSGMDKLYGGAGNDQLNGGTDSDYLYGGIGSDSLDGGAGDDNLLGEAGDDSLIGGSGRDTIDGGAGIDTVVYACTESQVTIGNYKGKLMVTGPEGTDYLSNVEKLSFTDKTVYVNSVIARDDSVSGMESQLNISQTTLLSNDSQKTLLSSESSLRAGSFSIVKDPSGIVGQTAEGVNIYLGADGKLNFSPDETAYDYLADGETFVTHFTYTLSNSSGHTDTATVELTINGEDSAPVFMTGSKGIVAENSPLGTWVYTAGAVDDMGATTYSLGGEDADYFNIDAETGEVTLADTDVLVGRSNSFSVNVIATDSNGLSSEKTVTIGITTAQEDTFDYSGESGDFIFNGLSGDDTILTGSGNDIVRPGEGTDTVNTGAGNDIIVVVGQTAPGQYEVSDITNPGGYGIDLSSVVTLADLNDRTESEVTAGESIDGGTGTNRIVVYGDVDFTGVTLTHITQIQVNSKATVSAQQLNSLDLSYVFGDGESVLHITNPGGEPVIVDFSAVRMFDFKTLTIDAGITLVVDQEDVADLVYITGGGVIMASEASGVLNLTDKIISTDILDSTGAVCDSDDHHGTVVSGDILLGSSASEVLTGSALDDRIEGGAGDDTLSGGDGNDILRGGAGTDTMDGGAGDDTFVIVGDLSGGGKMDSDEDTAALGHPLTELNGLDLNEDQDGAAETITGGEGNDTLYVYGTADLSNYNITGIEQVEIRSHVTFNKSFFDNMEAGGKVSITGDGSSTLVLEGGSAGDPLIIDLTGAGAIDLSQIGQIDLGQFVVLRIDSLDQLGGARILTGDGRIEATTGSITLPDTYTVTGTLTISNADDSDATGSAEVLEHVISGSGRADIMGTNGDDYLIGTAANETLDGLNGDDLLNGKSGNDLYKISGSGTKIIIDSAGTDTIDGSGASSAANINLTDGGTIGTATVQLGSGASATSKMPLDLFIAEDLSGSFGDDVTTVRGLLDNLISQVKVVQPDTYFGAGSFVDKPIDPFGELMSGDYVYRTDSKITDSETQVKAAFDAMTIHYGADGPESQLEALYQIALRTIADDATPRTYDGEIDFRPDAVRFVVLATDAPYHQAGDYVSVSPNNGDTILDGSPAGTGEDYPSVAEVKETLIKANIVPIFAVAGYNSVYENLVTQFGRGDVVNLSSDSSDLINSITTGLANYKVDFIENLTGTDYADELAGNSLNNFIRGGGEDDILTGLGGNDFLIGGDGDDTAVFSGTSTQYDIIKIDSYWKITDTVEGRDGIDYIEEVERLQFSDKVMDLTLPTAQDLFDHFAVPGGGGAYEFFALLSSASYVHTGVGDEPDDPLESDGFSWWSYQKTLDLEELGFSYMTAAELGINASGLDVAVNVYQYTEDILLPVPVDVTTDVYYSYSFSDGFYGTDKFMSVSSSFATVGKTSDALFITFRGTDQLSDWWDDAAGMHSHYAMYEALTEAIDNYLKSHSEIKTVYVSGHSLGGQMATLYMNEHLDDTDVEYKALVFEAANKLQVDNDGIQMVFNPDIVGVEMPWDPVPDLSVNPFYLNPGYVTEIDEYYIQAPEPFNNHSLSQVMKYVENMHAVDDNPFNNTGDILVDDVYFCDDSDSLTTLKAITVIEKGDAIIVEGNDGDEYTIDGIIFNSLNIDSNSTIIVADDKITASENISIDASSMDQDIHLIGNGGNNTLIGGSGNDVLIGGADEDILIGGEGNDILYGSEYDDIKLIYIPTLLSTEENELVKKYANDSDVVDDVSYLIGGMGKDTMIGSSGDNDYFFIDVDLSNNINNVDNIENFYVASIDSDISCEDYLIFSLEQLGISVQDGWSDHGFGGHSANSVSYYNFLSVDEISDYTQSSWSLINDADGPMFILDLETGDFFFDKDGFEHDVNDKVLLANIASNDQTDIENFGGNQILVVNNFDLFV